MTHADGPLEPSTPGNSHPGVTPLFATFMTVFVVVTAIGSYLFWKRRHTFPISARFPLFAVVGQVLACLWVILDSVRHIQKGLWPCQLVNFVAQMCIPLFLANYTVRAFGLLFKFGVARAIAFVDSDGAAKFEAHVSDTVMERSTAAREAIKNSQPPPPQSFSVDSGPEEPTEGIELNLIRSGSTHSTDDPPDGERTSTHRTMTMQGIMVVTPTDGSKAIDSIDNPIESPEELSLSISHDIVGYESDASSEVYNINKDFFSKIRAGGHSSRRVLAATYFLKRRRFAETPFLWRLYAVALFIHGSVWLSGVVILVDSCDYHTLETVIAGLVFIYLCLWVVLAYKLKKTGRDNFGFKEELGLTALFAFCAIVIWSVYGNLPATVSWDENVFALSDLLPMLAAAPGIYVSIWRPVYISYKSERESEALERKLEIETQQKMRTKRRSELLGKLTLKQLLDTEPGFETFKQFLQGEFSVENISFWRRINQYKIEGESNKSFVELLRIARLIGYEYIMQGSVMEINISAFQSKEIVLKLGMKTRAQGVFSLKQVGQGTSRLNMFQRALSRHNSSSSVGSQNSAAVASKDDPKLDRQRSTYSNASTAGPDLNRRQSSSKNTGTASTPGLDHQHSTDSTASAPGLLHQSSGSPNRMKLPDNVLLRPATPITAITSDNDRLSPTTDRLGSLNKFTPHGPRTSRSQSRRTSEQSRTSVRSQREARSLLTPEELRCVFDVAHKEIYKLMAKDSFLRYRRSPFFAQFIQRSICEGGLLEEDDDEDEVEKMEEP